VSERRKEALLVLEDGRFFKGFSFGASGETFGEVVFNTSLTGYQEILTDPSYAGQIVTMTYPHIGNYGVNDEDMESRKPFVAGFIVREASPSYSNWRAQSSLSDFLKKHGIVSIEGIDTRALTKHIRLAGAMKGGISTADLRPESLLEKVRRYPSIVGRDLVRGVTVSEPYWWEGKKDGGFRVVAYDGGLKFNIARELSKRGCAIYIVPASFKASDVLSLDPDGVFLSNGPGDPAPLSYLIQNVKEILGKKPVFGICLGHQILSLALGAKTFKLKFGHRGANHPVKNLQNGEVEITSQNHGFAVDVGVFDIDVPAWEVGKVFPSAHELKGKSDFGEVMLTHVNLNDGTVEGIRCLDIPAFSVQYHPEASPGPHDSKYLFDEFIDLMREMR
jgi:carbamoyl-phosphate synthase small subunit